MRLIAGVDPAIFAAMAEANILKGQRFFAPSFPLYLTEARHGRIGLHSHDFFEMVYVRRGRGEHIIEGRSFPMQSGDLYIISPGERHTYAPLGGETMCLINVLWMPALVEDALHPDVEGKGSEKSLLYIEPLLRREMRFRQRLHLSGRMAYRVEMLLDEMRHEQNRLDPGRELLLRHLFCALLVLLSRASDESRRASNQAVGTGASRAVSGPNRAVALALELIEERFAEPLRVEQLASHAGLSPSRLAHLWKQHTGRGINQYLHEFRINRACAALLESDRSVSEVALEVGYADSRFFHRMFRRHTGCSPTQFRRHGTRV